MVNLRLVTTQISMQSLPQTTRAIIICDE